MKITRKHIHALNDCFEAVEGEVSISLRRHRHAVIVDCVWGDTVKQAELSMKELALLLLHHMPKQEQQWGRSRAI